MQGFSGGPGPLTVRPATLYEVADRLAVSGQRLGHGLGGGPELTVEAPGWAAADLLAEVAEVVHRQLCQAGADAVSAGRALAAAADGYAEADARSARRLGR
ncbi:MULTISPECIES: hypothetical protein [unclassified Solwaraspora]|uniref:hypothetical protein n=1 Tax=unclassified Solwaraspora TaxID=2627926 RepID=UPI00259B9A4B|nr:hypothetical protein [Solwaraspora sp. WMMA2056]WJK42338.1 hypothetical protein O7608_08140 [Solwaraspora sp. WMMA2056]